MLSRRTRTRTHASMCAGVMLAFTAGSAPFALAQGQGAQAPAPAPAEMARGEVDTHQDQGLPVLLITSVVAMHPEGKPEVDLLRVSGVVSSHGWNAPRLVPTYGGPARDEMKSYLRRELIDYRAAVAAAGIARQP